jgi:hypothetical protein
MDLLKMFLKKPNRMWMGILLMMLILATRLGHFGSHVTLPDATLAVLFLGGILELNLSWLLISIGLAFMVDWYAVQFAGVSNYCLSLGYWGLIPTYMMVWLFGRLVTKKPFTLAKASRYALVSMVLAFVVSNLFWYAFSDKVSQMNLWAFSKAVSPYLIPYLGYTLFYLGCFYGIHLIGRNLSYRLQRKIL